ncbi:phytanoyl-CoA dioxygenase family protein [Silvibacterium sp.]|uniref:phytanoyl-CoA dioxygenase family protein n=1 Tax=Silvibacterium sp. TaxID=1964179 RepID=UPI0039E4E8F7
MPMLPSDALDQIGSDGFLVVEEVFPSDQITSLREIAVELAKDAPSRRIGGARNILTDEVIAQLAVSEPLRNLVTPILGAGWRPVRGILFDKIAEANWKVPWHQDLTIAVQERMDAEGFGPWSIKAGIVHVQPPVSILEQMVAVRIHLDDCSHDNGPLRVIPGSHRFGRIPEADIERYIGPCEVTCTVGVGGVLLMRPLILHASSPAVSPAHRRVIHIEYADCDLPQRMSWQAVDPFRVAS